MMERPQALALLKAYNQEAYHIRHALTVEEVMRWFAHHEGYEAQAHYWGLVGLLHDIDFERYPDAHCQKAPEILKGAGADDAFVRAVCSHTWGIYPDSPEPVHQMEKILFACDELTGLIYAATLMRPSRSAADMEVKSLRKKFKDKAFAAGCSREVISRGAELLGWPLDVLMEKTLSAMRSAEPLVEMQLAAQGLQ